MDRPIYVGRQTPSNEAIDRFIKVYEMIVRNIEEREKQAKEKEEAAK